MWQSVFTYFFYITLTGLYNLTVFFDMCMWEIKKMSVKEMFYTQKRECIWKFLSNFHLKCIDPKRNILWNFVLSWQGVKRVSRDLDMIQKPRTLRKTLSMRILKRTLSLKTLRKGDCSKNSWSKKKTLPRKSIYWMELVTLKMWLLWRNAHCNETTSGNIAALKKLLNMQEEVLLFEKRLCLFHTLWLKNS